MKERFAGEVTAEVPLDYRDENYHNADDDLTTNDNVKGEYESFSTGKLSKDENTGEPSSLSKKVVGAIQDGIEKGEINDGE